MKYLPLFCFEIKYGCDPDKICPDFRIEPTAATATLLRNHRAVVKPFRYGVQVLIAVANGDNPLLPLNTNAYFDFHLYLQNKHSALFTDAHDIQVCNTLMLMLVRWRDELKGLDEVGRLIRHKAILAELKESSWASNTDSRVQSLLNQFGDMKMEARALEMFQPACEVGNIGSKQPKLLAGLKLVPSSDTARDAFATIRIQPDTALAPTANKKPAVFTLYFSAAETA